MGPLAKENTTIKKIIDSVEKIAQSDEIGSQKGERQA